MYDILCNGGKYVTVVYVKGNESNDGNMGAVHMLVIKTRLLLFHAD